MEPLKLRHVDKIEITILVDNYSDVLLPDAAMVKRLRVMPPAAPLAEHGLACLISAHYGTQRRTILMDGGISGLCLQHNARLLNESAAVQRRQVSHRLDQVEAVVLSHGHFDHFCGLPDGLRGLPTPLPLVVHPAAFVERSAKLGADLNTPMPALQATELEQAGAVIERRSGPSTLANDCFLVTGQVPRVTDFEKGAAYLQAKIDGNWTRDPFTDDQGIALDLKHKGLVVISGCAHSGIVNMVSHCQRVSGVQRIFAILGGFHLTGADDTLIDRSIAQLRQFDPQVIVPMHCSGWKAINACADSMPDAFVLNSVGTTYVFDS